MHIGCFMEAIGMRAGRIESLFKWRKFKFHTSIKQHCRRMRRRLTGHSKGLTDTQRTGWPPFSKRRLKTLSCPDGSPQLQQMPIMLVGRNSSCAEADQWLQTAKLLGPLGMLQTWTKEMGQSIARPTSLQRNTLPGFNLRLQLLGPSHHGTDEGLAYLTSGIHIVPFNGNGGPKLLIVCLL